MEDKKRCGRFTRDLVGNTPEHEPAHPTASTGRDGDEIRFDSFRESHAEAGTVAAAFSIFPVFVFYVVGIASAGFHLGNGLFTFLITWGITVGQRAQRISQIISAALAIIVTLVGLGIAVYFVSLAGGFVWWFS